MQTETLDLVVVGCGAGGLATAAQFLDTHPAGRVVVLERTDESNRGGNTAWTGAFFRLEGDGSPAPDFEARMHELGEGKTDSSIIERLAREARPTIEWLQGHGVAMIQDHTYFLTSNGPRLMPQGGGAAIVESLARFVVQRGGRIEYSQTATDLLVENGVVVGVRCDAPAGPTEWRATTVVLASGGFEGSADMLDEHLGDRGHELSPIAPGGRANQGEGIQMALAAGAERDGQFERFHGEPVDPRTRSAEALVMVYPYGILVDHEARRFVDEASDTPDNTFEAIAYKIWRDADQFAYVIADQKLARQPITRAVLTDRESESADTLAGLAKRLGLDADKLTATVDAYNAATKPGDIDVTVVDGVSTCGLEPPKSNWARPIDEPPFIAWPVTCAITFTFGGVRTDADARVVGSGAAPIPGLYAVGETAGIYHHKYPGATSVLRALVFGRVAGRAAAERAATPITH